MGSSRNQSSIMPDRLREMSSSLNLMMKNSSVTMKTARRKLEIPMPAAMPCKLPIKSSGETRRSIGKRKTKYACVVDADESTRPRLEGAVHKHHQDHITAKEMNSMSLYSLVHKFNPMPKAMNIPDAKAAVVKM